MKIFTKRIISSHPTVHRYSEKEYLHPTLLYIDIHKKNIFITPYCTMYIDIHKKNIFIPPYCTMFIDIHKKNIFSHPTAHRYSPKRIFSPTLLYIDIHKKNIFIPPYCS